MNDRNGSSAIDLDNLPEPVRSMLRKQLAKIPAPMREKLLREGSPVLERLVAAARKQAAKQAPRPAPTADTSTPADDEDDAADAADAAPLDARARERVPTVMPGDTGSQGALLLTAVIALAGAVWYALQG